MNKKKLLKSAIAVTVILALVYVFLFPLGFFYISKPLMDRYRNQIEGPYYSLNEDGQEITYTLPEQYHYFGRYAPLGHEEHEKWMNGERNTQPVIDDRQVYKIFFSYNEKTYYLYYNLQVDIDDGQGGGFYYTWPDVYDAAADKVAFTLLENPEGCTVRDNYLYYSYGKNYYSKRTCTCPIPEGDIFNYYNYKDYRYARVNLDTLENEEISKQHYEKMYGEPPDGYTY